MKKILVALCSLIFSGIALAQAPQGINYQGVARDNQGQAFSITNISVQVTFQNGSGVIYQEHQTVTTDTFGLYNIVIGSAAAVVTSGSFSSIPWSAGNILVQVDIDPSGAATNWTTVSTMNLQSVPYALYAQSSGNSSGGTVTSITVGPGLSSTASPITTTATVDLPTFAGVAGTWGSSATVPTFTVDSYGRITGVSTNSIAGAVANIITSGSGISSANSGGTYTLTVDNTSPIWNASQLMSKNLNLSTLNTNDILQFNGTDWVNVPPPPALPNGTNGQMLFNNAGVWTPTIPSQVSCDGNSITVANTTTVGTAGTFITNNAGALNAPALLAQSNSSTGYAIRADNSAGAAIVANSGSYYAIAGNMSAGSGHAVAGWLRNSSSGGYGIYGLVDNTSSGSAGYFENQNPASTMPVMQVVNAGPGRSAIFSGGSGVQIDSLEVQTNLHIPLNANPNWVLTSDTYGNARWAAPPTGVTSVTVGSPLTGNGTSGAPLQLGLNNGNIFVGNSSNLAAAVAMSGDVNITNTGLATVTGLQGSAILPGVPSANQVLQFNGTNWVNSNLATLPAGTTGQILYNAAGTWTTTTSPSVFFTGSNLGLGTATPNSPIDVAWSGSTPAMRVINNGNAAEAGVFNVTGAANNAAALVANTSGTGHALVANAAGGNAINAVTSGTTGVAGSFQNTNASNNNPVVNVVASAAGPGVNVNAQGSAPGIVSICNTSNGSAALFQTSNASSSMASVNVTSDANSSPAMVVSNTGGGGAPAATFSVTNAASSATAVSVFNSGGGAGISVSTVNDGVNVLTSGTSGSAAHFQNGSTANNNPVVAVAANGAGPGVNVNASGSGAAVQAVTNSSTGSAGFFQVNNSANSNYAVSISSNANLGPALIASNNGTSSGSAANFNIYSGVNSGNAVNANTAGTGYSGSFTGGQGFQVDGFTADLKIVPNGGLLMGGTDYFFIVPNGTTGNLTLPPASAANKGKMYVVKCLGSGYNCGGGTSYISDTGVPGQTSFPANSVVRLVCDGTAWQAW